MKYSIAIFSTLLLFACGHNTATDSDKETTRRTSVTLTHARLGSIEQELSLQATTAYLTKTTVTAPVASFIKRSSVNPGFKVGRGTLLYLLESKEQHALDEGTPIEIRASQSGVVVEALQQTGSYVTEGQTLCTVADASSLVFEISVPYEKNEIVRNIGRCDIVLPDGKHYKVALQQSLASMDAESQSMLVVARAKTPLLPEGMRVKAIFKCGGSRKHTLLLPKQAVQSSEDLTEHWVMKLKTDGTVSKTAVTIGNSDAENVEILNSTLSPSDRVILSGSYGLEDGAKVSVAARH